MAGDAFQIGMAAFSAIGMFFQRMSHEKNRIDPVGLLFSAVLLQRLLVPAVADVCGFLQEDDGSSDGLGNVPDAFNGADDEKQVDVEGGGAFSFWGDQEGQRLAVGLVQFFVLEAYFPGGVRVLGFQAPGGVPEFGDGHVQQREHNVRAEGFPMPDGCFCMLGDARYFLRAFMKFVTAAGEGDDEPQVAAQRMELGECGGTEGENLAGFLIQGIFVRNNAVGAVPVRSGDDPFQYGHVFQQDAADSIDAGTDGVQGCVIVGKDVIAGRCHDRSGLGVGMFS